MHAKLLQARVGQAQCTARPSAGRTIKPRSPARCLAAPRVSTVTAQQSSEHKELPGALAPAMQLSLLSMLSAAPALAQESEEAAAIINNKLPGIGLNPVELFVLLSPLILYGLFNFYRDKYNPRANLGDFFFLLAGCAVLANIASILLFKMRLF